MSILQNIHIETMYNKQISLYKEKYGSRTWEQRERINLEVLRC